MDRAAPRNGALVPSRPYLSSSRTTSSSSGVETSSTSTSVTATIRWIVPGVQWKLSPTFMTRTLVSSTGPTSRFIVPVCTRNVSSFLLWYCRESA